MPTVIEEGRLTFTFPAGWDVTKYDAWAFYRNQFGRSCGGNKAVDILAYHQDTRALWLVEIKDYRQFRRTKTERLWDEMALKVRDTLAGLVAAHVHGMADEHAFAARGLGATTLRVVLHLEQPRTPSKLFPRAYDPADVQQKLKQMLKPIDAHPLVVDCSRLTNVPWSVTFS